MEVFSLETDERERRAREGVQPLSLLQRVKHQADPRPAGPGSGLGVLPPGRSGNRSLAGARARRQLQCPAPGTGARLRGEPGVPRDADPAELGSGRWRGTTKRVHADDVQGTERCFVRGKGG